MSEKKKRVRLRMTTNSTAARAGQIVERQEAEAKRLIAAGQAEPYEPVEYVPKADFDALAARVAALESGKEDKPKGGKSGKET